MAILEEVAPKALNLSLKERAKLAELLLESLDSLSEAEIEELWATEAERRLEEYQSGRVETVSAESVFREANELLR